ncbi:flagellar attachment zone protein 1-like [Palaemon carinicauda]|uniref:flagellar attachment zone protein 1-like n=1 Tax=Palaemon carinicauda TaxID=392227 RepID=UPI0035B699CE
MAWCWGGEDSHREAEKFLDLIEREEMERLQPAVYGGANHVAGETRERTQLEEVSQKDLSEKLDGEDEGIQLFDDFLAKIHQETETGIDLKNLCEEVHGDEAEEVELSNDIANLALIDDLERANKNIESLMVSLEKAEVRNDKIRDELLAKVAVEKELENAHEEIRMLEKRLERVTGDLETANKKLWEKSDLQEYVESADNEIRKLWAELDSVKAENKRVKSENVLQKATLESELNAAVEEVYRIGTKLDTVLDENSKLKTELLIKKEVVCDLEMAEEELWKEIAGVKAENRRLKRDLSEERTIKNMLVKANEKNKKLEEEIRNLTSVADEFAIYKEKYQHMMERNMNLERELNHKNYAITQLVDSLSQIHPELKELYHMEISETAPRLAYQQRKSLDNNKRTDETQNHYLCKWTSIDYEQRYNSDQHYGIFNQFGIY